MDERFKRTLNSIKDGIQEIQKKNNNDLSFGKLYCDAYTMVSSERSEMLYGGVQEVVTDHLIQKVREDVLSSIGSNFLQTLNQAWNDHQTSMVMIKNVLSYLDRVYVQKNKVENVYNLGLIIFRNQVVLYGFIQDHLRETLLDMVTRERRGEVIDRLAIKNACQMLMMLGIGSRCVYEEVFERPFLIHSTEFYRLESQKLLREHSASEYITKVQERINEEAERAKHYLDESTEDPIVKVVNEELLSKHLKSIAEMENSGVVHMLKNKKTEALGCMYKLFSQVPHGLETIIECVSACLREQGRALVTEEGSDAMTLVESLLDLKNRCFHFVLYSFNGDEKFERMIYSDFTYFLNLENSKLPEYLLLFIDDKLKKEVTEMENSREVQMLKNKKSEALAHMYKLLSQVPVGLETLMKCVRAYLREQCRALVTEEGGEKADAMTLIESLLDLKDRFFHFLLLSFNGDKKFERMISDDFTDFLSLKDSKLPEYLSLFIDNKLRKEVTEVNEQEIDKVLDQTIDILKHVREKDVFMLYYKEYLAQRLLSSKCLLDDSEKNMISKLKSECGSKVVYELEKMFQDIYVSNTMMEEFKAHVTSSGINLYNVDLKVKVILAGIWPGHAVPPYCNIPMAPRNAFEVFRQFYVHKHSNRKIILQPELGSVDMLFSPQKEVTDSKEFSISAQSASHLRQYKIQVSTCQMCVLMLFNSSDCLTYEEISNETGIPKKSFACLKNALQSLANQGILIKMSETEEIEPAHQFRVNDSFYSKYHRVKVQAVPAKRESEPERKETRNKIVESRRHEIQAAIVRIMKAQKCMKHEELLNKVTQQLRFPADPVLIKRGIEFVIDKEFLARSKEDKNIYTYVA